MDHPIKYMLLDLLECDLRHDRLRAQEIHKAMENRGYRVTIEKIEPPRPQREAQGERPEAIRQPMSPAEEAIYFRDRPRRLGPGIC